MKEAPLVTVLICTYNYVQFIGKAIESIIDQTYPIENIEVVVIDDGSIDDTKRVVEQYNGKIQLLYIYQVNNGKASATRLGIEKAKGKYIFMLDADDYYLSNCLSTVVASFEKYPNVVQVSHLAHRLEGIDTLIDQEAINTLTGVPINGTELLKKNIFKSWSIGLGSTFSGKASVLKKINIPDDVDMYIDYYLFLAISSYGEIIQLDEQLSVFRRHDSSYSEGSIQFEQQSVRALRYLKSAKATCRECLDIYTDFSLRHFMKFFYYSHLWGARKFVQKDFFSTFFNTTYNMMCIFLFYKNKTKQFKNNLRVLIKK
jgi:glycosyltransferase involved in cell wall biosynthesis